MKNTKKLIIIILIVICVILTIIAFILGRNENNSNKSNNNENYEIRKIFNKVDNYEEFFSIQYSINDNLNLTKHFSATEIYTNNDSKVRYYFVKGNITEMLMDDETYNYENVNYLLIVNNSSKAYEISMLSNNISDLQTYANSYNVKYKDIKSSKILKEGTDNLEVVLSSYIEYFKNLLFFNPKEAYNMLTNTTKSKYNGYDDFYNNLIDVYDSISSNVHGYNIEEKEDYKIYNINDNKYNKITIIEYGIMDFKIEF